MDFSPDGSEQLTVIASSSGSNIIASTGQQVGQIIDVRQWSSYYLVVSATTSGTATGYNPIRVDFFWAGAPNGANLTYADLAEFWADNISGLPISLGAFLAEDVMHGPYMQINFTNNGGNPVSVQWRLMGTTRPLPGPYFRQQNSVDGILSPTFQTFNINAGATVPNPMGYGHGRAALRMFAGGGALTFTIFTGSFSGNFDQFSVAAGANQRNEFVLPKRALSINVTNANAGVCQYANILTTLYDKS